MTTHSSVHGPEGNGFKSGALAKLVFINGATVTGPVPDMDMGPFFRTQPIMIQTQSNSIQES